MSWLVVKVRPLCSRGSANIVEEGVPGSDFIVLHMGARSGLFSRSARNSSHFFRRASSDSLRVTAQASRYSARLSHSVSLFDCLVELRGRLGLSVSACLRLSHMESRCYEESRVEAMDPVAE